MIRLTSMALAALSLSLPAFANQCELSATNEKHQVSEFILTVKNEAAKTLWVTTKGKQKPGVTISSGKSLTRTFQITKDRSPTDSNVELSDFGVNVGSGTETDIGHGYNRIWNLRFTVTNALTAVSKKKTTSTSSFTTDRSITGPKTRNFEVKCSAEFRKKGKNAWAYTIEIADE